MADVRITDLTAATSSTGADVTVIVQGGTTKKLAMNLTPMLFSGGFYTGATGSGATNLDGEVTVGLAVDSTIRAVLVSGSLSLWNLVAGTDAENVAAGVVRPDDYATTTNEKVWKRVLGY
jgi:hypothetical protein